MSAPLYVTRLSARVARLSPPFSDFELADGDTNVWRHSGANAPGEATSYTDWADAGSTLVEIFNPVLSPDRSMIAYAGRFDVSGFTGLFVCDNAPNSPSTLLEDDATGGNINTPMWSPDSNTIVFTRAVGNIYGGRVESIPATGGSPTVLYTPAANYVAFRPAYSYNGAYIAFNLQHTAGADDGLWVMAANGTGASEIDGIIDYNGDGSQFGWANNELTIAYDDGGGAARAVYTIAHNGTGKTTISTGATNGVANRCGKFCWSADDSEVIVSSNLGTLGMYNLFSLDPAGGGETSLNASEGPANQTWCRVPMVFEGRIWFIRRASGLSGGRIGSTAMDGSGYIEELDVTDGTLIDWFGAGTGFEYQ